MEGKKKKKKHQESIKRLLNYKEDLTTDLRLSRSCVVNGPITWIQPRYAEKPKILITGRGVSINGFHINFNFGEKLLEKPIGFALAMGSLPLVNAQNNYYFKDLAATIYKIYLSGIEDLQSVITSLIAGECGTVTTTETPQDLVVIKNYYDHGRTAPYYAATLFKDKLGIANATVVDCVSGLVEKAHNAWEDRLVSWPALLILGGGLLLFITFIGCALYFCPGRQSSRDYEDIADRNARKMTAF